MKLLTAIALTWQTTIFIYADGGWLLRRCPDCHKMGKVDKDGRGALAFVSSRDWVCAECGPHREARLEAPIATIRRVEL
jgi:hypothetical protein